MRHPRIWALGLLLALPCQGQASSPFFWKANPRNGRLEILTPLGGWNAAGPEEISLRLVDPKDPRPPADLSLEYWERWQARRKQEEEGIDSPPCSCDRVGRWQPPVMGW